MFLTLIMVILIDSVNIYCESPHCQITLMFKITSYNDIFWFHLYVCREFFLIEIC